MAHSHSINEPVWRNWQTHKTQNLAGATSCGFKSHRRHCIIETSNPNGFGAFFYKGLEFQWNFCGKLYDPKTKVLYIAFFIHINYYIVI